MNYNDERIKALELEKSNALNQNNTIYNDMLNANQQQLEKSNSWQDAYQQQQNELLDRSTALSTGKLEQKQKDTTEAYKKEAIASEASYQDFINPYGTNAEKQAENNLNIGGYAESTKATAYSTARVRTALAKATAQKINAEYDVAISEAKLNNDSQKAQLALDLLKEKLTNEANALSTSNSLKQNMLSVNQATDSTYYNRYQDVFNQQKYEQEQALEAQRYAEELAYQKQQDALAQSNWEREFAASQKSSRSGSGGGGIPVSITDTNTPQIKTNYYSGAINPDTQYGTFGTKDANGVAYQPNNIGGQPLSSSKKTVSQLAGGKGNANSSGVNVDNQTVWKLNGKYYIWNGSKNKYEQVAF